MPIFRYHCNKCDFDFELLLARFDSPAECPQCGSADLEKAPNRIGSISSSSRGCAMRDTCPGANSHSCGCTGGCCGHRH